MSREPALKDLLERLYEATDAPARLAADPVAFPRRYTDPADQEVAALVASTLAYGRVAAFRKVLDRLFAAADAAGGPRRWVDGFDPARDAAPLLPLVYRWNRGPDFVLLARTLQRLYADRSSLEPLLVGETLTERLDALIGSMRREAASAAGARDFAALPRGFRAMLPRPADGSACKRWWMFLRWMVRPPTEGIDLGLWRNQRPADLIVPLDTHVLRISRFVGLTDRTDASGRTAAAVTAALRRIDPDDPVRFDFALAHLGISGACKGHRDVSVCPACPLDPICTAT